MKRLFTLIALCFCLIIAGTNSASAQAFAIGEQSEETQKEALNSAAKFLTLWLVDQDIEQASRYFVLNWMGLNNVKQDYGISQEQIPNWSKKILVLLLENHKDVITHSAKEAQMQNSNFDILPTDVSKTTDSIKVARFQDAINFEDATQIFFGNALVLAFQFRHTSQGDVNFVFEKIDGNWKIVNFFLRYPHPKSVVQTPP